ncbi:MAG: sulfatase [Acidobacteriota bacterium]
MRWCACSASLLILLITAIGLACKPRPHRYNILLVSVDTLRADRLGYTGYPRDTTPNLDRLAETAYRFTDVITQAPSTSASHESLFTSLYPSVHRQSSRRVSGVPYSIASILKENGYQTAGFVDGGYLRAEFGFGKGFDLFDDKTRSADLKAGVARIGLAGINPKVRRWLESKPRMPFFVFVHTYDVHCPYTPPEPYFSKFASWYRGPVVAEGACGHSDFNKERLDHDDFRYLSDLYDGGVAYLDSQLQALFELFREHGLFDDMLVVITSDHGESLGERGYVGHNMPYEEQLHVPMLWRIPGEDGREVKEPAQNIDVLPTLCAALGIKPAIPLMGTNMLPYMRGEATFHGKRMRLTEGRFGHAIRFDSRYKLIVFPGGDRALYDLQTDPLGQVDATSSSPGQAREMMKSYRRWLAENRPIYRMYEQAGEAVIGEETKDQLKALGYVQDE